MAQAADTPNRTYDGGTADTRDTITMLNSKQSPLLRLPAELRNQIYENVLGGWVWRLSYAKVSLKQSSQHRITRAGSEAVHPCALLQACRQLYAETSTLPFSLNIFVARHYCDGTFFATLTKTQRDVINEIRLDLGYLRGTDFFWCVKGNRYFEEKSLRFLETLPALRRVHVSMNTLWNRQMRYEDWDTHVVPQIRKDIMEKVKKAVESYGRRGVEISLVIYS